MKYVFKKEINSSSFYLKYNLLDDSRRRNSMHILWWNRYFLILPLIGKYDSFETPYVHDLCTPACRSGKYELSRMAI